MTTRLAALLALALVAAPVTSRAEEPKLAAPAAAPAAGEATATIPVKGMNCGGCVRTVTDALKQLEGVRKVEVSLEKDEAVVVYDRARVDAKKLAAAIDDSGFKAGAPAVR